MRIAFLSDIHGNLPALQAVRDDLVIHVNPSGEWRQGGFDADAGLTGRWTVRDVHAQADIGALPVVG